MCARACMHACGERARVRECMCACTCACACLCVCPKALVTALVFLILSFDVCCPMSRLNLALLNTRQGGETSVQELEGLPATRTLFSCPMTIAVISTHLMPIAASPLCGCNSVWYHPRVVPGSIAKAPLSRRVDTSTTTSAVFRTYV